MELKILFVEDDNSNIEDFKSFCEEFADDHKDVNLKTTICKDEEETIKALTFDDFNAAIIDLNLNKDSEAGIRIIDEIHSSHRIPMIVFSGNANRTENKQYVLKSITKGKETYGALINELYKFNRTGIMNILGKTGCLEELIDKVFWENIHPKMPKLQEYTSHNNIEKDLLRYIVNHFNEILEDEIKYVLPDEMYICPPINSDIKTGSIIKNKSSGEYYIVMSPACDIQQGCDRIISSKILAINSLDEMKEKYQKADKAQETLDNYYKNTDIENQKQKDIKPLEGAVKNAQNSIIDKIINLINKPSNRFHFLYGNENFDDSVIDFHEINTIKLSDIALYEKVMSVTTPFLKDIQSRFSSYYGRQGSPDLDSSIMREKYKAKLFPK